MVRTDVSEERIASIFRAGESRREYSEQVVAATEHINVQRRGRVYVVGVLVTYN
jgi:hypothetical protein